MTDPFLEVEDLSVVYPGRRRLLRPSPGHHAVRGVSLTIAPGETLGLVGESGSGKTTLGRAILGLQPATAGRIRIDGVDLDPSATGAAAAGAPARRRVQAVFQDPFGSLNPTKTVGQIVAAPARQHLDLGGAAMAARVDDLLARVGLEPAMKERYPYEFSGGQRQRIAIARALSADPALIVLDEAVSALDVSVQSQVINLLEDIQDALGVAYLFIAHDLAVVRHISDRVAVMHRGVLVEEGEAEAVCSAPTQAYTQLLLASAPEPDPTTREERRAKRQALSGVEA